MIHNAWIMLDGDLKSSKEFVMENSSKKQVLRRLELYFCQKKVGKCY